MRTRNVVAAFAVAAGLFAGCGAAAETFTVLPEQTYDVIQPGPRGDIALWIAHPPGEYNSIRACARVITLDPHRLFSPLFSVVLIAGDEVLRLRIVNDDRNTTRLPVYIRRDSVEAPETAVTSGSRRKVKKEVRMGPVIDLGVPFDIGLTWTPEGKVDVMIRYQGHENHVTVALKTRPTGIRVVASSGYWRVSPFEFGNLTADDPNADPDLLRPVGCRSPDAERLMQDAPPPEDEDEDEAA
jgi:hypothetical protein